jgi:hypothetical protein
MIVVERSHDDNYCKCKIKLTQFLHAYDKKGIRGAALQRKRTFKIRMTAARISVTALETMRGQFARRRP